MKKRRWVLAAVLSLALFAVLSYAAAWLLIPPRQSFGGTWESYRQEEKDSIDVLFFGSSLVYCNVVPGVIWEESGITTYLMAGPEQTMPITYSYIKEACRTQSPKVIAVEITGMFYPRYCNFTKANISYMPWSVNRLEATFRAAEPELHTGLLFPLLDYHSRWSEVTAGELAAHLHPGTDIFAGYTFLDDIAPQGEAVYRDYTAGDENYARNLEYLQRIADFCGENGAQLLLFLTPTKGRIPPEALAQLKEDVSALPGAVFMDFNECWDELGIDDSTDWHDFLHFNCRGADKFSRYLAGYLAEEWALPPTGGADESLWQARAAEFAARLEAAAG
ncbi:MAG: hypothetical protein ACI4ML_03725 [Aristaeellaceae bacterium]